MSRIPAVGLDPEEFEPRERARSRPSRPSRPGSSREKHVDLAYQVARMRVDLEYPTIPGQLSSMGGGYLPAWAMRRAYASLVKEGVLRGPDPVPRRKGREMAWYRISVGMRNGSQSEWVGWAEGSWRASYSYLSGKYLYHRANGIRADIRRSNKRLEWDLQIAKEVKVRARFLPIEKPVPAESQRARVERLMRSLKKIDWDGLAFFPVPGPAMEALKAWREKQFDAAKRHDEERRDCARCGGSFPRASWVGRKAHSFDECNVLVVTRIMTE